MAEIPDVIGMDAFLLLGWKIRKLRLAKKLSQEKFAALAGITFQGSVSELERGIGNPTLTTIAGAAYALGVSIPDLFSTDGAPKHIIDAPHRPAPPET